jgi:hypothetical protein
MASGTCSTVAAIIISRCSITTVVLVAALLLAEITPRLHLVAQATDSRHSKSVHTVLLELVPHSAGAVHCTRTGS